MTPAEDWLQQYDALSLQHWTHMTLLNTCEQQCILCNYKNNYISTIRVATYLICGTYIF